MNRLLALYRALTGTDRRVLDRLETIERRHMEMSRDLEHVKARVDPLVELVTGMRGNVRRPRKD